jgi:molecular chaperone GrpE
MNERPADMGADELWDKYLRSLADQENARKRHMQELRRARQEGVTHALREVLPAVDELERATASAVSSRGRGKAFEALRDGLQHTHRSVQKRLRDIGLEAFDSIGQDFDPTKMEALSRIPDPNLEPGKVAGELERGYLHEGKLLRPARVAVVVKPEEGSEDE